MSSSRPPPSPTLPRDRLPSDTASAAPSSGIGSTLPSPSTISGTPGAMSTPHTHDTLTLTTMQAPPQQQHEPQTLPTSGHAMQLPNNSAATEHKAHEPQLTLTANGGSRSRSADSVGAAHASSAASAAAAASAASAIAGSPAHAAAARRIPPPTSRSPPVHSVQAKHSRHADESSDSETDEAHDAFDAHGPRNRSRAGNHAGAAIAAGPVLADWGAPPDKSLRGDDSSAGLYSASAVHGSGAPPTPLGCCARFRNRCWRAKESCKRFVLSFVGVLALSSAVSISLACIIIILLWFRTAQTTVGKLSGDYRGTVLSTVKGNIERQLTEPLVVLEHLEAWASLRFGDFSGIAEIDSQRGFLAGLALERQLYPALSTIGIGVHNGLQIAVQNQKRSIPAANVTGGNVYLYNQPRPGEAVLDADGQLPQNMNLTLHYFQLPQPNPSRSDYLRPDFINSDEASNILATLGSPIGTLVGLDARKTGYFPRGVAVARRGQADLGWNAPIDSTVNSDDLTVSAVKPSTARKSNGDPYFVCFATILMTQLDDILRSYSIGQHGRAFVFTSAGRLIASSVPLNPRQRANTNLFQRNQFSLDVPSQLLIQRGFVVENATDPSLGGIITHVPDLNEYDEYDGVVYNMRASQLVIPALSWIIVVFTLDTDFDGGLDEAVRTTSILSAVVVLSAVILTVLLARLLTSPLLRVSALMQDAVVAIGMDKGRRQRRALRKLNREFERQTGMKVNEADPDADPGDAGAAAVVPVDPSPDLNGSPTGPVVGGTTPSSPLRESSFLRIGPSSFPHGSSGSRGQAMVKRKIASEQGVEMHAIVPAGIETSPHDLEAQLPSPQKVMRNGALRSSQAPPQPWWRRWFCCCMRPAPPPVSSNSAGSLAVRRPSHSAKPSPRRSGCLRAPGSCLSEVKLMHASIGSMLHALSSYDQLEHINNAKRSFIRYIFHEVRVPFNAVVLATEQLQMYAEPLRGEHADDIRDLVQLVSEQATVVARILNDVLSMQKIEDGGLTLSPEAFDFAAMVRVTLSSFKEGMIAKQITLVTDLPCLEHTTFARKAGLSDGGQRLLVWGDRYRLRQVLGNFISNAIAYSPAGGTITVRLQFDEKSFKPASANGTLAQEIASNERASSASTSPPKGALDIHASQPLPASAFAQKGTGSSLRSNSAVAVRGSSAASSPLPPRTTVYATASSAIPPAKGFGKSAGLGMQSTMSSEDSSSGMAASSGRRAEGSPDGVATGTQQGSHSHTPTFGHALFGSCIIRLSVSDCGPGIPLEHQSKIFSAYKQVQSARIQQGRGTGLGLQISKSIVELHGGRIGFTTQPGLGTDFFFSLALPLLLSGDPNDPNNSRTSALLDVIEDEDDTTLHQHAARERDAENEAAARAASNPRLLGDEDDGDSDVASVHFVDDDADPEPAAAAVAAAGIGSALATSASPAPSPNSIVNAGSPPLAPPSAVVSSVPAGEFPASAAASASATPSAAAVMPFSTAAPSLAAAASASASASSCSSSSSARAPSSPRPRVLVVEDSIPNRKLLCNLLKILQCDVVGAEHGQAAVDLFAEHIAAPSLHPCPFDLVLMDGSMPVMSGLEATVYLRSHGLTLPILAVTGNALQEDVAAFLGAGAQFVLTKPINRAMLVHAMHKHLPSELAKQIPAGK